MANSINQRSNRWRIRSEERRSILVVGDLLIALLALGLSLIVWGSRDWLRLSQALLSERIPTWYYFLPLLWILFNVQNYDIRRSSRRSETIKGVAISFAVSLVVYLLLFFALPKDLPRFSVGVFLLLVAVLTLLWRLFYIKIFTAPELLRRVLVVGAGRAGSTMVRIVNQIHPQPFIVVGFIDDDPDKVGLEIEGVKVLGDNTCLLEVIEQEGITDVIFAISGEMSPEMFRVLLTAEEQGVEITTMPIVYEHLLGRVPIFLLASDWILRNFVDEAHADGFFELGKRLMDVVGGLVGTIITTLLLPIIALAIVIDSGRPIFFLQTRLGISGREYKIIKFRTMHQDAEKDGKARVTVENDDRVTRVGRFLRKSHLDELPQFVNVLRGEMSLVGPRAERSELVNGLQKKVPFYRARLLVKPGITGWAQVNFGYAATVEDTAVKLEYDLYYIKHRNLLTDIIILLKTFSTVFGFKGQ